MDIIIEFLGELLIEGSMELATNKKISKWIRYPVLLVLITFYSFIIFVIGFIGIKALNSNIFIGIILIVVAILILIVVILAFFKIRNKDYTKENN